MAEAMAEMAEAMEAMEAMETLAVPMEMGMVVKAERDGRY